MGRKPEAARAKSSALAGSMWYSTVTRTGPRSASGSVDTTGAGQCNEGLRSAASDFGKRYAAMVKRPTMSPEAAAIRATGMPAWGRDVPPEDTAYGHATLEGEDVQGQRPAPHP